MNRDEESHTVKRLNLYGFISKSVVKVLITLLLMVGSASAATEIHVTSNVNDVTLTINGMSHIVVDGSVFNHPNTAGSIPYSISKAGYTSQYGNITLPMESVYNWSINLVYAPTYKLRVGTGSGIGTAAVYKNGALVGALDYYANFVDINGFITGDHFTVTYSAMSGHVIDKYCDESINQCYINSGNPITVQNIEGNIGFSNTSITVYPVQSLSISSLSVTEQAPNNVRVAIATTGKGTIAVSLNGSEMDFSQVTGTILSTFDYVVDDGVTNVCAYDKNNPLNVISCRYINISHPAGVTPTVTATPPIDSGYHINVTTYPNGARVTWGGDDMGLTPLDFYTHGMNNYNISITKEGYAPYYESGVFTADRDFNLTLTPNGLPENRGTHLLIDSYPHGAKVFKNSDLYGTTPTEMYLYGMNQTTLVFKLDGYWDKTISGDYNTTTFINAILVSKSGSNPTPPPDNNPVTPPSGPNNDFFQWMINSLSGMIGIGSVYSMPATLGILLTIVGCFMTGGVAYRETRDLNVVYIVCALMVFLSWAIGFFPGWALLLLILIVVGIKVIPAMLTRGSD